jgi:GTPase SAR1 family protein
MENIATWGSDTSPHSGVSDHLRWIRGVLDELGLSAATHNALRSRLSAVEERLLDPELRIAVVGAASSGKSTLINAFLRRRLLPPSALITTRATMTLRHGYGTEGLSLGTTDGQVLTWPSAQFTQFADAGPADLATALRSVLVTDRANHLHRLEVWCPTRVIGDQVTIIDTPSFSVDETGHRELAADAIDEADLVIVVTPAVSTTSLTTMNFLAETTRGHRDRCVFVITKTDLVDDAELNDVVTVTQSRLADAGFPDPVVLTCAPELALRELARPNSFLTELEAMEARLTTLAAHQQALAIAATVNDLLTDLIAAIEESAQARRRHLTAAQEKRARLSLPDFPAFLKNWRSAAVDRAISRVRVAAGGHALDVWQANLDTQVVDAVAGDRIKDITKAAATVSAAVRLHLRSEIDIIVGGAVATGGRELSMAVHALAGEFAIQFSVLSTLAGSAPTVTVQPFVSIDDLPTPDLSAVIGQVTALADTLTSTNTWRTGDGAGALLGARGLPGVGTLLGGLLGGAVTSRGADATRTQFLAEVRSIIETARTEVHDGISTAVDQFVAALVDRLTETTQEYQRRWDTEIDRLMTAEAARLGWQITTASAIAAQARSRVRQVGRLRHGGAA